ncbi:hypothetical protein [Pseudorhodoferax soli]|nr:hypothetical protein [Pseudorhodoferax soli]
MNRYSERRESAEALSQRAREPAQHLKPGTNTKADIRDWRLMAER